MDIYSTYYMLAAIQEMPVEHNFFKNRYFPTNQSLDVFGTAYVLADFKEDSLKRAPFVMPRIGALPVGREGFSTATLEPMNIAISKPLTIDQLQKRGFGESLLSTSTPADRARMLLMGDLQDLNNRIARAEEVLAIKTMIDNGCTMIHRSDNPDVYESVGAKFYEGNNNPAQFTPQSTWAHSTYSSGEWTPGNWYDDICSMIRMLTSKGRQAREILVSPDVGDFLMTDGWILAMLDNRRAEFGRLQPEELGEYVYTIGTFNFKGRLLPILVSDGTYEDDNGNDVNYIPDETVIVTAPGCGRGLYGAVTIIQNENSGFETIAGTRVPEHIVTKRPPAVETQVTSRPLFVPTRPNPWTVAKSVLT